MTHSHDCLHYDGLQEIIEADDRVRYVPQFTCRAPTDLVDKYVCCGGSFLYVKDGVDNQIEINDKDFKHRSDGWYLLKREVQYAK